MTFKGKVIETCYVLRACPIYLTKWIHQHHNFSSCSPISKWKLLCALPRHYPIISQEKRKIILIIQFVFGFFLKRYQTQINVFGHRKACINGLRVSRVLSPLSSLHQIQVLKLGRKDEVGWRHNQIRTQKCNRKVDDSFKQEVRYAFDE